MAPTHKTSYTVSYDSESHWAVLTQLWGSKWPDVLPYCLFNVAVMVILTVLERTEVGDYHLEISTQGHSFITFVVAFLLISRVNMGLARYSSSREALGVMYREARGLVQSACVFSGDEYAAWRNEIAYRTCLLLRTSMQVIDYPTDGILAWEIPELNGIEKDDILKNQYATNPALRSLRHHKGLNDYEESFRVPVRVEYLLRQSIAKTKDMGIAVPFQNRMYGNVAGFMNGYYGMRTFLTTPVPFPLIQMARTFLFLYVFTVPFVLLQDDSSLAAHSSMVFVLTYGFVGLELVAIELDNPFGDDANDFNNAALAETAYEDTYLTILDRDGEEWTEKLRSRMTPAAPVEGSIREVV